MIRFLLGLCLHVFALKKKKKKKKKNVYRKLLQEIRFIEKLQSVQVPFTIETEVKDMFQLKNKMIGSENNNKLKRIY